MIDRDSCIAMYEQIVSHLRNEILHDKYEAGANIGTQQGLAKSYSVSLITIRRAMQILEKEGLVEIKQGKGTFIKDTYESKKRNVIGGVNSGLLYQEKMRGKDVFPKKRVLSAALVPTPKSFPENVMKALGASAMCFEYVEETRGKATCYAKFYITEKLGSAISVDEFESISIYDIFRDKFNVTLGKGVQRLRAMPLDIYLTNIIQNSAGTPVLYSQREIYDADDQLLVFGELYNDYKTFELQLELNLKNRGLPPDRNTEPAESQSQPQVE